MNIENFKLVLKGLVTAILPFKRFTNPGATGGTINSRYCYSVWMRHLLHANNNGIVGVPKAIAELGPGDTIGIGLAALLSGSEKYISLDVYLYTNTENNLRIFDELVYLFNNKSEIPNELEFPRITPLLDNYNFPRHILTDEILENSLNPTRILKIRTELQNSNNITNSFIKYLIPWNGLAIIKPASIDLIISQAVLQYVDDLNSTYKAMHEWLKVGGVMSHSIDFSSHGLTSQWNGHWTFSTLEWKIIRGRRKIGLNRFPISDHLKMIEKYKFKLIEKIVFEKESVLTESNFSELYKNLSIQDITTASSFIQASK